jgi:signal peptidase II
MLILSLSFVIALLDQVTKFLVRRHFVLGDRLPVLPGAFNLTYVQNTGAAWGIFAGLGIWLIALSFVMLVVIVAFRHHLITHPVLHRVCVGLIIAGIVGNLVDRIRLGYVVDFLDFYWRTHHFPAFNVADSAICTGVGLYMLSQVILKPAPAGAGTT